MTCNIFDEPQAPESSAPGWLSDLMDYRYSLTDPLTGWPWPLTSACFAELVLRAAARRVSSALRLLWFEPSPLR